MSIFQEAYILLHVAEKALMFPQLKPLHDAAVKQLSELQLGEPKSAAPKVEPIPNDDRRETFQQQIEDEHGE